MENTTDFREIIRKIDDKRILLPDFQRGFVWKDEERQKKLVASILAKMPVGSILLLKAKPNGYSSKRIGCRSEVDISGKTEDVEFLLDGQQRITVLTNVFSNVIHDKCGGFSNLISTSLKKRFFLRIPKWVDCKKGDLFGVYNLDFGLKNPNGDDFDLLSGEIYPYIECINFLNGDQKPFNPQVSLSINLDNFCLTYESGYLVPLYLMAPGECSNKDQIRLRYTTIVGEIAKKIGDEIRNYYSSLKEDKEKEKLIKDLFSQSESIDAILADETQFYAGLLEKEKLWEDYLKRYLDSCIMNVALNVIVVPEERRVRAIDIYENLNRGGVSLNTFDLIMARIATVSHENFYQRLIKYITSNKQYPKQVLPDNIAGILEKQLTDQIYNASVNVECYNAEKNEVNGKYIDVFLDVMSLYCNNPNYLSEEYKIDLIKRNKILELNPSDIDANAEKVCQGIDRAMFFFQTRCGIRSIQEINYSLMIVILSVLFMKDSWFENKKIHNILEGWYWASIFSGEFDKDQNTQAIIHLQKLTILINNPSENEWLLKIKNNVLDMQNFSDEGLLLLEKTKTEEKYPKTVLKGFMCQYLLSKTYTDMFDSSKTISVFDKEADTLEAHHIIPLGSVKKVGESTVQLRRNSSNICNSPLNFVYITQKANKEISADPLSDYVCKLCDEAKAKLYISAFTNPNYGDTEVKSLLRNRYTLLKGNIREHINTLIN